MNPEYNNEHQVSQRIVVLDILRGVALAGILLLHHIEHFNIYARPEKPLWGLTEIDQIIWDSAFFMTSGKAFSLLSILFGFSYWTIFKSEERKGFSYKNRHFWRMALLLIFGLFHTVFFFGDILILYAFLGLILFATPYMNNRAILLTSTILLLCPYILMSSLAQHLSLFEFDYRISYPSTPLYGLLKEGDFFEVAKYSFIHGIAHSAIWYWNEGRFATVPGLFLLGVLLARKRMFTIDVHARWFKLFTASLVCLLAVIYVKYMFFSEGAAAKTATRYLLDTYHDLAQTGVAMALVLMIFAGVETDSKKKGISGLAAFGRMALTNYILMSIVGTFLYYNWGLGLYRYLGSTPTLLIALAALLGQIYFSKIYISRFKKGPLETLWSKLTWLDR